MSHTEPIFWEKLTLGEAGVALIDCVHKTPPALPSGLPYIAIPQMKAGRLDFGTARQISEADFVEWTRKALPQADDVVLSRRCNPGTTAAVKNGDRFALGQNLVLLRADGTRVYPPILRWLVRGHDWWNEIGRFLNVGAVFDSLRCADVPKFELPIPPLEEQRAIATVLGSLDDKIELNRRMNRSLEQMAGAIFKAWFVDFEPVRAKASGAASFPGMPQPVFDALPATFADSEIGPIPEGWETRSLDEIADYLNGLALQKYPPDDGPSLPRLKIAQLRKGDTEGADMSNSNMPKKYIIQDGDVIFSWSGSLLVKIWTGGKAALNQHLFKVTSEQFPKWFYYFWTAHHLEDFQRTAASKATTMGHIKRHHLSDAKVVIPPSDSPEPLASMTETVQPLLDLIIANDLESRTLAETRDALLPKLLSGEVRIHAFDPAPKLDSNGESWPTPTKRELLTAAALLDDLERESPAEWPEPRRFEGGRLIEMPVLSYGEALDRLHKLAYDIKLVVPFDWMPWAETASRYIEDADALTTADLVTIQKLMTVHMRREHFCEGTLASLHEQGHLAAVLRRIGEIAEEMG